MKDRELLEMAARAAGIEAQYSDNCGDFSIGKPYSREEVRWNPLTDDGDALRLAGDVGLVVCIMRSAGFTGIYLPACSIGGKYDEVELHGSCHFAATRRAIVLAAAEIGRGM